MTVDEYLKQPYQRMFVPEWNDRKKKHLGYSAEIREFPGCFAQGKTIQEASQNLESAAEAWLTAEIERGHSIPPPFKGWRFPIA